MAMRDLTESHTTEFKSSWRDGYLKIICAFANTEGGELIIGVDDKDIPVGVKNSKKLLENLPNKINNKLGIMYYLINDSIASYMTHKCPIIFFQGANIMVV